MIREQQGELNKEKCKVLSVGRRNQTLKTSNIWQSGKIWQKKMAGGYNSVSEMRISTVMLGKIWEIQFSEVLMAAL